WLKSTYLSESSSINYAADYSKTIKDDAKRDIDSIVSIFESYCSIADPVYHPSDSETAEITEEWIDISAILQISIIDGIMTTEEAINIENTGIFSAGCALLTSRENNLPKE
ncbi:hypothetical protein SARC_05562, partial [Sphaeroforma arctica JP610]